jgi:hypothetical protein
MSGRHEEWARWRFHTQVFSLRGIRVQGARCGAWRCEGAARRRGDLGGSGLLRCARYGWLAGCFVGATLGRGGLPMSGRHEEWARWRFHAQVFSLRRIRIQGARDSAWRREGAARRTGDLGGSGLLRCARYG